MVYIVIFGKYRTQTGHRFRTRKQAIKKAKELKKKYPHIFFKIKKE